MGADDQTVDEKAENTVGQTQNDDFNNVPRVAEIHLPLHLSEPLSFPVRKRDYVQHEQNLATGYERLELVLVVVEVGRVDLVIRVDEAGVGEFEHQHDHGKQVDVWVEEGEFHEHRAGVFVDPGGVLHVLQNILCQDGVSWELKNVATAGVCGYFAHDWKSS